MRSGPFAGVVLLLGSASVGAATRMTETVDPAFELVSSGQSLAAALFLLAGVRIARGRRRG